MSGLRIALYSHDTMGLGHIRRNLLIANTLSTLTPSPSILLVSGTPESLRLNRPKGSDIMVLPGYRKDEDGGYHSKSLGVNKERLAAIRSGAIASALRAFAPDVLIVDKVPTGACNELMHTLQLLKDTGKTRLVLGLRDILDDPITTEAEWEKGDYEQTIAAFYDDIWIYGDPAVFDVRKEYAFSKQLSERAKYLGYLARPCKSRSKAKDLILCLVGGGQDGFALASAFARTEFEGEKKKVLVTGPYMPDNQSSELSDLAKVRSNLTVKRFVNVAPLISAADSVISMGGYNTVCELLANDTPALIVPRVQPRLEQAIRAERLSKINAVSCLLPDAISESKFVEFARNAQLPRQRAKVDLGGCNRLLGEVREMLSW